MRIGLYSTSHLPTQPVLDGYGGVEVIVGSLAKYFDEHNHEVHLFAAEGSYEPKHGELHSFKEDEKSEVSSELKMFQSYDEKLFKSLDVIHDNSHWHFVGKLVPDIKYLYSLHALKPCIKHFDPKFKYNMVTLSYEHAKFEKWLVDITAQTVFNGIELDKYPYKGDKGNRLLWISRLFPPKGALEAIEIAERVKMPIDIIGGSHMDSMGYSDTVKRMCRLSEYANFVGEVSHEKKIKYLQDAKCVIFPVKQFFGRSDQSINMWLEPGCMIPLEANACGTPIIATPNGFVGETISDGINGFLAFTIDDFVWKINRLYELSPKVCRERAEYFSVERMAESYLSLYKKIINGVSW